jgi:hypothetical protein
MSNFTLRLPENLDTSLAAMRPTGQSRHAQILHILEEYIGDFDPDLILGHVKLHSSEISPDVTCPECHTEFADRGIYIGFTADLKAFGPVCGLCASTQ